MGVSVIVGGQYGSEGKGKVSYFFTKKLGASCVVRVGGPNSGHTIIHDYRKMKFQTLPVSSVIDGVTCVLPAGSYIDIDRLQEEISISGIDESHLKIHPNAVIITESMKVKEINSNLHQNIGSTNSGTGAGVMARVSREESGPILLAQDSILSKYVCDTTEYMRSLLDDNREIIIEGTQGFGLSLFHTSEYPFATSRDTTAAGFLSEAGLSPFDVKNIIMVIRAFPIRVAGNSGTLPNEISWKEVTNISQSPTDIVERTTVTNRIRRVANFDARIVKRAIAVNKPNVIVLNHCDYFDYKIHGKRELSFSSEKGIASIEEAIGRNIDFIGTSDSEIFSRILTK